MDKVDQNKIKVSHLSPDVSPFTPKEYFAVPPHSTQNKQSQLSVHVNEFVPSWLKNNRSDLSLQSHPDTSIPTYYLCSPEKQFFEKANLNKPNPETGSEAPVTQHNKQDDYQKPTVHNKKSNSSHQVTVKPKEPRFPQQKASPSLGAEDNVDSEFPALGATSKQDGCWTGKGPVSIQRANFAVSFSEKLKSSNINIENTHNNTDKGRQDIHVIVKDKNPNFIERGRGNRQSSGRLKNKQKTPANNDNLRNSSLSEEGRPKTKSWETDQARTIVNKPSSDDSEFHVVKNKTKRRIDINSKYSDDTNEIERTPVKDNTSSLQVADDGLKGKQRNGASRNNKWVSENTSSRRQKAQGVREETRHVECPTEDRHSNAQNRRKGMKGTLGNEIEKEDRRVRKDSESNQGNQSKSGLAFRTNEKSTHNLKSTPGSLEDRGKKIDSWSNESRSAKESNAVKPRRTKGNELNKVPVGKGDSGNNTLISYNTRAPLSYSDILKKKPEVTVAVSGVVEERPERGVIRIPKEAEEEMEASDSETKTKKKKKKKKKKSSETPQPVKKTKEPIMFDFGDMFAKLEERSTKKKQVIRAGGLLPAQAPIPPKESRILSESKPASFNPLDSTAPIVYHKKEREAPKRKKPSSMRKILTKDREERKMLRDGKTTPEEAAADETADEDHGDEEDEESEHSTSPSPRDVKKTIHSRKFREYCDQDLDYDINGAVIALLKELIRFQDRLYQKDPVKAKAKRRFVCGLREVFKHVKLKRLKCVLVTPNMEPTKSKGGLDDILANIIDLCHSQNVPVVFCLNRQILGKILLKKVPVSIVGIFYYDGAQNYFKTLMELTKVARETYQDRFEAARKKFLLQKIQKSSENQVIQQDESVTNVLEQNDSETGTMSGEVMENEANPKTLLSFENISKSKENLNNEVLNTDNETNDLSGGKPEIDKDYVRTIVNIGGIFEGKEDSMLTNGNFNSDNQTDGSSGDEADCVEAHVETTNVTIGGISEEKKDSILTNENFGTDNQTDGTSGDADGCNGAHVGTNVTIGGISEEKEDSMLINENFNTDNQTDSSCGDEADCFEAHVETNVTIAGISGGKEYITLTNQVFITENEADISSTADEAGSNVADVIGTNMTSDNKTDVSSSVISTD